MYLSRIEMTGFKSFADKTVIEFDKGMTAVVGPNGSGKSNLSEAIRWVLGEQSAKSLRGNRMEDVIFNGTQERKAVNIAKVTLVLNNEDRYLDYDYSEISISRSYNRNGDSNYSINNETVRLKDIVDLLLDSGLGKNSFSIISQGQVEQIFLNKPEERRTIFEEAAGVQKYQYRKHEAERKLAKSSDNLNRVKDIIYEIEQQLEPLAKQREAALIYQEKRATLKQLEISLYTYQIQEYKSQWQLSEAQLREIEVKAQQLQSEVESINQTIERDKTKQDELVIQIDEQSDAYQATVQKLEQLKAKEQMVEQQITFNQQSQTSREDSYTERQQAYEQNQAKLTQLNEEYAEVSQELEDFERHIKQLTDTKSLINGDNNVTSDELRDQLIEWYQKDATAKNQLNQYRERANQVQQRKKDIVQEIKLVEGKLNDLKQSLAEEQLELESINNHLQESKQAHTNQSLNQNALKQQRENLRQQLFKQERQVQQAENQRQNLENMQANYVGYYAGVRAVMTQPQHLNGIVGTVADLIDVDPEYQTAIDTAMGGSLQSIVVEDDQAAKEAVNYLKQQRAGRATFLPRTNIKPRHLANNLLNIAQQQKGFMAIANEKVTTALENQAIVANILGTTIVSDTIDNAQAMAKKLSYKVKIVTLDGEVLMPGGSITGGRNKQQASSMLQRQNELQVAIDKYEGSNSQLVQLEQQWDLLQDQEQQLAQELEDLRSQTNRYDLEYQQLNQKVQNHTNQLKQTMNQLIILKDEQQQLNDDYEESVKIVEEAEKTNQEATAAIERINQELNQQNISEEEQASRLTELEQQLNDSSTQKAVKEVEFRQLKQQITELKQQIQTDTDFIAQYHANTKQSMADIEVLEQQLHNLRSAIKDHDEQSKAVPEKLKGMREERQALVQRVRKNETCVNELQQQIQANYKQQAKLEAQIEKYQSFIDNQLDYLSSEYQLSFEAASQEAKEIKDSEDINKTVKQLKRDIENLGPINLQSIEDYDALNERYQLLTEQQDDLLTAMAQLEATMAEMDQEVTKRFGESFKLINEQFQITFRRLFAGGQAYLKLTDPNDLLTTGVDIIAQPPGKKKQNLALLSGGERALTAIALLFAILEVKPVPFVVLDEVEAALDDANVYRYGEYIKDFTEDTQFIVITHRKGTMESADVLYGVTMDRTGVSKLASVQLSQAMEEIEKG